MKYLLILLLLIGTANAEPVKVKLNCIPKGATIEYNGVKYRAFKLDEWKQLIACDAELGALRENKLSYKSIIQDTDLKVKSMELLLDNTKQVSNMLTKENMRLYTKWVTTDEKLQKALAKDKSFMHYIIEGSLVLTIGVLTTVVIFSRR